MKPIEPGCKCVIIKDDYVPENVGKVITVIKRYRKDSFFLCTERDGTKTPVFCHRSCWSIREQIQMFTVGNGNSTQVLAIQDSDLVVLNGLVSEPRLMRIDGDDFDDNPYQEKKPISDVLNALQSSWMSSPETWDEYQRRVQHG